MDKLCDKCRALAFLYQPFKQNEHGLNMVLMHTQDDHDECVKVLLEAGADVNVPFFHGSPLVQAARRGHVKRLQALIAAGADVNKHYDAVSGRPSNRIIRDQIRCQNALTHAVSKGNIECVEILIKAGANVNKVGHQEISVLRSAFQRDHAVCADSLIKAGADVNSEYGYTPLYYAVTQKANRCLDLLLKAGADVHNAGSYASTALMFVQDKECCRNLLKHHSRVNRRNLYGDNVLTSYIRIANPVNEDLCSLLFAAGETVPQKIARWFPQHKVINAIDYLPQIKIQFYLKQLCREAIRSHLLELDPRTNLFDRIPRLGLPTPLAKYLLYNTTLDSSSPPKK